MSRTRPPRSGKLAENACGVGQGRLSDLNASRAPDARLLLGTLLVCATARSLAKVPEFNGRYEAEPYEPSPAVYCGVTVALLALG